MLEAYGAEPGEASFANNCLLARRLVEQACGTCSSTTGAGTCTAPARRRHRHRPAEEVQTDRPADRGPAQRPQAARAARRDARRLGRRVRPHGAERRARRLEIPRPRPSSALLHASGWPAAASKPGHVYGATDDLGYFVTENKVGVHDLQATILHLLGFDAKRFSFPYQGLNQRLIGPSDEPRVVKEILA